jgi:hypothetical protein
MTPHPHTHAHIHTQEHNNSPAGSSTTASPELLLKDWRNSTDNELHTRVIHRQGDTDTISTALPIAGSTLADTPLSGSSTTTSGKNARRKEPRKMNAKKGRGAAPSNRRKTEPALPGAISDDEDAAPLLTLFRPKSALNVDLD